MNSYVMLNCFFHFSFLLFYYFIIFNNNFEVPILNQPLEFSLTIKISYNYHLNCFFRYYVQVIFQLVY